MTTQHIEKLTSFQAIFLHDAGKSLEPH